MLVLAVAASLVGVHGILSSAMTVLTSAECLCGGIIKRSSLPVQNFLVSEPKNKDFGSLQGQRYQSGSNELDGSVSCSELERDVGLAKEDNDSTTQIDAIAHDLNALQHMSHYLYKFASSIHQTDSAPGGGAGQILRQPHIISEKAIMKSDILSLLDDIANDVEAKIPSLKAAKCQGMKARYDASIANLEEAVTDAKGKLSLPTGANRERVWKSGSAAIGALSELKCWYENAINKQGPLCESSVVRIEDDRH